MRCNRRSIGFTGNADNVFKERIERHSRSYKKANKGATYTPYAATIFLSLASFTQLVLARTNQCDKSCQEIFNAGEVLIGALSALVIGICAQVASNKLPELKEDIRLGIQNRWFSEVSNQLAGEPAREAIDQATQTMERQLGISG